MAKIVTPMSATIMFRKIALLRLLQKMTESRQKFLDTQVSLAPTHVSPSVGWSVNP